MGIVSEPYWLAVLASGGRELALPNARYQCGAHMWAHPDAVMDGSFLVELKSESGFGYKKLLESYVGVQKEEVGHYVQAQLYMHATGHEWTLYLTTPPDPGLLQSTMRQRKKYGRDYLLEPVYLEWIARDEDAIAMALARAEMLVADAASPVPPPREFSGVEFDNEDKRTWPCGYCLWLRRCNDAMVPDRIGDTDEISFV
jgi:hypothetical protein